MHLVLVTAPVEEPIEASDVKSRLNIGSEVPDEVIEAFITAARQTIDGRDGWLGRAIMRQSWKIVASEFPFCPIDIPLPPLISVDAIRYIDNAGIEQVLIETTDYVVTEGRRATVMPAYGKSWPNTRCQPGAVEIEFTCGYESPDDVPEPMKSAITLMVSNLRSLTAQNLFLSQDTVEGVGSKQYIVGGNAGAAVDSAVSSLLSTYREFR